MKPFIKVLIISLVILQIGCQKDETDSIGKELDQELETLLTTASDGIGKSFFLLPESDNLSAIPSDPKNPLTAEKVALGRNLFHETGISQNPMQDIGEGTYSCASCHFASAGFQAGRFQGLGEGGIGFGVNGEGRSRNMLYQEDMLDCQPLKSPSAMNGAYQTNMLWNGMFGATGVNIDTEALWTLGTPKETNHLGYEGLETQAIAGLKVHRMKLDKETIESLGYKDMFDAAFPDIPEEDRYSRENAGLAIGAFERTILSNEAPFQEWLKGNSNALSNNDKRGAILFFGDAECSKCHTGPALSEMEFYALGMNDMYECPEELFKIDPDAGDHLGRGGFTGEQEDMYKFKVPQMYNLSDSPFYGHGNSFRSIRQVLEYKNLAVPERDDVSASQLSEDFHPLNLTETEINYLVEFIEQGLRDPNLKRYEPDALPSGNCFPNNDALSKYDLGCD